MPTGRRSIALSAKPALALAGAIALGGCLHGDEGERRAPPERPRSGPVAVEERPEVDAPYVTGDRLQGVGASGRARLATAINTDLVGMLSPAAAPGPRRLLAYNSRRARRPVVRVQDLDTGRDVILDEGALSLAWRGDGALAYFKALRPEVRDPRRYVGHVVVRREPEAEPGRWTARAARYVVAAWAGDRLLAYRIGSSWPDLIVLDGPRRERMLARSAALVALSPDGRRAFVSRYGASPPLVRVLDVRSGHELARRSVGRLRWLSESGAWVGDLVAATASGGVAIFRVGGRTIAIDQVLDFAGAGFTVGPLEPRLEDGGRRIVGWAELESRPREALPRAAVLACDRASRRCSQGPPVSTGAGLRLVYDPSRP